MVAGGSHAHPRVVVVGSRGDAFVGEVIEVAVAYELEVIRCDDVYSATMELAGRTGGWCAAIGRFRYLKRDKYMFFDLARRNGVRCCCLLDNGPAAEHEKVMAAVRRGARPAGGIEDVRVFLKDWLAAQGRPGRPVEDDVRDEDFRATQAELSALLGHRTDE